MLQLYQSAWLKDVQGFWILLSSNVPTRDVPKQSQDGFMVYFDPWHNILPYMIVVKFMHIIHLFMFLIIRYILIIETALFPTQLNLVSNLRIHPQIILFQLEKCMRKLCSLFYSKCTICAFWHEHLIWAKLIASQFSTCLGSQIEVM
jgi:hypothetical protein